jgi:hypothetical protein
VCRHCGPISHLAIVGQLRANGLMAPAACEEVATVAPLTIAEFKPSMLRPRVAWKSGERQ